MKSMSLLLLISLVLYAHQAHATTVCDSVTLPSAGTGTCQENFYYTNLLGSRNSDRSYCVTPSPLDPNENTGAFHAPTELAEWQLRSVSGPYKVPGDRFPESSGTPGDWSAIVARADAFVANGETTPDPISTGENPFANLGIKPRDAAFVYLLTGNNTYLNAVKPWLLQQAAQASNDFTVLCYRYLNNATVDGYGYYSSWLSRVALAYDFVKDTYSDQERALIEAWLRRNAYVFEDHTQWGLSQIFPNRKQNDYSVGLREAALSPSNPNAWYRAPAYPNANHPESDVDCTGGNGPAGTPSYDYYTHTNKDGSRGYRVPILSLWFNNRRSMEVLGFGIVGLVLGDQMLLDESKRYVREWLTYGIFPDGTQGDYQRNGNYCIPSQGIVYSALNGQTAAVLAAGLARRGDWELVDFRTRGGKFGTEAVGMTPAKTIALAIHRHLTIVDGTAPVYFYEPTKGTLQQPRAATRLVPGSPAVGLYGAYYSTHDLGYLPFLATQQNPFAVQAIERHPPLAFPTTGTISGGLSDWPQGPTALFPGELFMWGSGFSYWGQR
jgi:hypothetical protein